MNGQIVIILVGSFLVGAGEELWLQFFPKYLDAKGQPIWIIGAYTALRVFAEGILYAAGGRLTQALGVRASMAATALLPLVGYAMFLVFREPWAAIAGTVLIVSWDPLSVPATFTVVGQAKNASMAFAIQSISKRLPKIVGPVAGGLILHYVGKVKGVEAAVAAGLVMTVVSLAMQWRYLKPGEVSERRGFVRALREMHPFLKRMLFAEILTRWSDWMIRDFIVLYCMNLLGVGVVLMGTLLAVQAFTSLATYLPIGAISEGRRRPFIGVTFVFFAAFPVALAHAHGTAALVAAFVVYGLREIGEPARKSLVVALMPEASRAEGVGAYWAVRSFATCAAPLMGAWLWMTWGPQVMLLAAGGFGVLAAAFYASFQRRFADVPL